MKKLVTVLSVFCCLSAIAGSEVEKKVKHDIKEVTVYLEGAQVTHTGSVQLGPGKWDLVFDGLATTIDVNSIQAKGEGDLTIMSVMHRYNYMNPEFQPKGIKALEDSLENLQYKLDIQKGMRGVYGNEQALLIANNKIGGVNVGVNVAELEKAANLLRNRLMEIENKLLEIKIKEKKLNETIYKIQMQLNEMNSHKSKTSGEILVSVSVKNPVNAKITISFLTPTAGWAPYYDIRAIDNNSPIKLDYKANVWQNSGTDWKDVKLSLSTGNPSQSGTAPTLMPWWLTYYIAPLYNEKDKSKMEYGLVNTMPSSTNDIMIMDSNGEAPPPPPVSITTGQLTQMSESQVNTTFEISIPYSIPSDSKKYSVEVQNFSIPATYKYFCAPKMDKDAFLLAKITGWDKLNLISGEANIFYEGMYVGKSFINTRSTSDTLSISLGRDKNVVVTRIKLSELCEKKILGTQKKESLVFEISVRNKKKQDIEIYIEDQVPLSTIKEIEVEKLEDSGAKYDAVSGKLTWTYKMASGDTKKIKFSYSVKFPKDKVLGNL